MANSLSEQAIRDIVFERAGDLSRQARVGSIDRRASRPISDGTGGSQLALAALAISCPSAVICGLSTVAQKGPGAMKDLPQAKGLNTTLHEIAWHTVRSYPLKSYPLSCAKCTQGVKNYHDNGYCFLGSKPKLAKVALERQDGRGLRWLQRAWLRNR